MNVNPLPRDTGKVQHLGYLSCLPKVFPGIELSICPKEGEKLGGLRAGLPGSHSNQGPRIRR